jgi:hypothetical protein
VGQVRAAVPTTSFTAASQGPDFACAYEVAVAPDDHRSAEQWARAAWEEAPLPMRWFLLAGWRLVLRLPVGPRHSPDHVLGWNVVVREPEETVCELSSRFLGAYNTFRLVDGRLVWSTFVTYRRPIARVMWAPAALLHRPLVRLSLRRAAHHA